MSAVQPLDQLRKLYNRKVVVIMKDRHLEGQLVAIDEHVNVVLQNCTEHLSTPASRVSQPTPLRLVRGDNVLAVAEAA
jgi:small nuclear ribonucleoprotein (snRNP)-like protein